MISEVGKLPEIEQQRVDQSIFLSDAVIKCRDSNENSKYLPPFLCIRVLE